MRGTFTSLALGTVLGLCLPQGAARADCLTDAMVVFDGSASMGERGDPTMAATRIADARVAVAQALPLVAPLRRIGLIVYGPNGVPGDGPGASPMESIGCRSVDLRFGPRRDASGPLVAAVDALEPGGSTPLTAAVAEAAQVLDYRHAPGVVVLITDGQETCGGTPCALAGQLARDAADLVVHVVGFRVRPAFFDWESGDGGDHETALSPARCLADETGGTYTAADTVAALIAALDETLGCALIGRGPRVLWRDVG